MARLTLKSQGELASFLSAGKAEIRSLKVHFTPKQEGTGDPSPENVRPIAGWTGVEAEKRGKNLVDVQDMEATYPWSTGTYKSYRLFIGANKTVTISYSSTLTGGYDFYFVIGSNYEQRNSSTGTWMYHKNVGSYIKRNMTVTTDDNGYIYLKLYVLNDAGLQDFYKYILDANFQVEYGTEVTSYEPYTGTTYTLDWTSDLGTLYGGYVDLISGEVVEEWGIIASYNGEAIPGEWLSDRDVYASGTTPTTGAQVAYELATPITHQLTPTEIQTLTGQNNFWSSADSIEVEYDLIETRQIEMARRNIIMNSPHVESITGSNASFITDMASNLKEFKIHFTPIQEGSGDPSPDNVRPIHGWDGVTIYNNRKVPVEYQEVEWIEGDMSAHIDTGIAGNDNTLEISFKVMASEWAQYLSFFGNYIDESHNVTRVIYSNSNNGSVMFGINRRAQGSVGTNIGFYPNQIGEFDVKRTSVTFNGQTYNYSGTTSGTENSTNIALNANKVGTTTASAIVKRWYYCKIKSNGELVRNFIPCYRKSDDKPGMYDAVTKSFFTSAGTGEFTVGPDVTGGEAYTIPFPQTIYGGYVDLVKGEVVEEWAKWVEDGSRTPSYWVWQKDDTNAVYAALMPALPVGSRHNSSFGFIEKVMCPNRHYVSINGSGIRTPNIISLYRAQNSASFAYSFTGEEFSSMTKAELKAYIAENPIESVYILLTPRAYPLDPVTIRTLKGLNNIWSDANGNIEIKYWTH